MGQGLVAAVVGLLLNSEPLDPPYQAVAQPLLVEDGPLAVVAILASAISLVGLLVAAGSLVVRFRRARESSACSWWMALAAALVGLAAAVILVTWATFGARRSRCGNG